MYACIPVHRFLLSSHLCAGQVNATVVNAVLSLLKKDCGSIKTKEKQERRHPVWKNLTSIMTPLVFQ